MTQQEIVERDVRIALGDLHLQLIIARAQVTELQQQLAEAESKGGKVNGKGKGEPEPRQTV